MINLNLHEIRISIVDQLLPFHLQARSSRFFIHC